MRAGCERRFGDAALGRIDGECDVQAVAHERFDDRHDARALVGLAHPPTAVRVRLAADVDDVGPERSELAGARTRAVDARIVAAVEKRVGRHVEDAHDARPLGQIHAAPAQSQVRGGLSAGSDGAHDFAQNRPRRPERLLGGPRECRVAGRDDDARARDRSDAAAADDELRDGARAGRCIVDDDDGNAGHGSERRCIVRGKVRAKPASDRRAGFGGEDACVHAPRTAPGSSACRTRLCTSSRCARVGTSSCGERSATAMRPPRRRSS